MHVGSTQQQLCIALQYFAIFSFLIEWDETDLFQETPPWSAEESLSFGRAALSPCACAIGREL